MIVTSSNQRQYVRQKNIIMIHELVSFFYKRRMLIYLFSFVTEEKD